MYFMKEVMCFKFILCVYAPKQPTNVTIKQKLQIVRTWNFYLQDLVLGC